MRVDGIPSCELAEVQIVPKEIGVYNAPFDVTLWNIDVVVTEKAASVVEPGENGFDFKFSGVFGKQ